LRSRSTEDAAQILPDGDSDCRSSPGAARAWSGPRASHEGHQLLRVTCARRHHERLGTSPASSSGLGITATSATRDGEQQRFQLRGRDRHPLYLISSFSGPPRRSRRRRPRSRFASVEPAVLVDHGRLWPPAFQVPFMICGPRRRSRLAAGRGRAGLGITMRLPCSDQRAHGAGLGSTAAPSWCGSPGSSPSSVALSIRHRPLRDRPPRSALSRAPAPEGSDGAQRS